MGLFSRKKATTSDDVPKIYIDRNGGMHVRGKDLAASRAFRDRLDEMVKIQVQRPHEGDRQGADRGDDSPGQS